MMIVSNDIRNTMASLPRYEQNEVWRVWWFQLGPIFPQLLVLWVTNESEGNIVFINIVMSFPFQAIILHELLVFKGVDAD